MLLNLYSYFARTYCNYAKAIEQGARAAVPAFANAHPPCKAAFAAQLLGDSLKMLSRILPAFSRRSLGGLKVFHCLAQAATVTEGTKTDSGFTFQQPLL